MIRGGRPTGERDRERVTSHGRSSQLAACDFILVTFQDLILQGQVPRVDPELAVDIRIAPALKAYVSFLSVLREGGHVPDGNHLVGMLIYQAHTGRNRPA